MGKEVSTAQDALRTIKRKTRRQYSPEENADCDGGDARRPPMMRRGLQSMLAEEALGTTGDGPRPRTRRNLAGHPHA